MVQYRLYLTDARKRIFDVHPAEFADDNEALNAALRLAHRADTIQVWQGSRFVGKQRLHRLPINFQTIWAGYQGVVMMASHHGAPAL